MEAKPTPPPVHEEPKKKEPKEETPLEAQRRNRFWRSLGKKISKGARIR